MEQKPTIWQIGLKVGLITGLVLIIYSLILQLTGLAMNKTLSWISYLIIIVGIAFGHKNYKVYRDGYMTYGQGLGLGTLITGVAGMFSSLFTYLYLKFIDDSIIRISIDQQIEAMEEQGMDDEQIDQALAISEKFSTPIMITIIGFFALLLIGFILSLIISAFTKKTNPELQY